MPRTLPKSLMVLSFFLAVQIVSDVMKQDATLLVRIWVLDEHGDRYARHASLTEHVLAFSGTVPPDNMFFRMSPRR